MRMHKYFRIFLSIIVVLILSDNCIAQTQKLKLLSPVLVTSCGQGPGSLKTEVLLKKEKIKTELETFADIHTLQTNKFKSLLIVAGFSREAMQSNNINFDDEVKRIDALIAEARKLGIKIIAVNAEGKGKRGTLNNPESQNNEILITHIFPKADVMIVRVDANEDNRFTMIAQRNKNLLKVFSNSRDFQKILKDLFE
jgi:hypothetical protein